MGSIPRFRLFIYGLLLAILPTLFVALYLWNRSSELTDVQGKVEELIQKGESYKSKQLVNVAVIDHFRRADNFYLSKYVEPLQFLQPQVKALTKVLDNKQFAEDPALRKRFNYLTGAENRLAFNEGAVVRYPLFKEIVETQAHPVEVDFQDIGQILRFVEGEPWWGEEAPEGRPQLIILEFRLDKKQLADDNQVFNLNMRLLKREYL